MTRLIIMSGTPGAGKTTYVQANFSTAVVCSADHYFMKNGDYCFDKRQLGEAHKQCFERFNKAMTEQAELIVIDNTSTKLRDLREYIDPALSNSYEVEVIVLKVPVLVAFKRNTHGVPLETIDRMASNIENTLKLLKERKDIKLTIIGE